jgi:hypothetical protein
MAQFRAVADRRTIPSPSLELDETAAKYRRGSSERQLAVIRRVCAEF